MPHTYTSYSSPLRTGRARGEGGQAMVEFALVVPILLLVLFACIEFGHAFLQYQQLSAATSEGARRAIVSRNVANREDVVRQAVRDAAPELGLTDAQIGVQSMWTPGSSVTVTSAMPRRITILGVTFFDGELRSTRTMRVEQ